MASLRSKISPSLKQVIRRKIFDRMKRGLEDWRLRRLIDDLRSASVPQVETLRSIRRAWGNEAFSADIAYLSELASRIEKCCAPILECGSGVTSIIAGVLAEKHNLMVWSLEQDYEWAQFVEQRLKKSEIRTVEIRHAPLQEHNGYVWYDIDKINLPNHFDLVLCDGPAVFEQWGAAHLQWRYGVIPMLADRGISLGEILLDDATEPRAENLLQRWQQEFGMQSRLIHTIHGDCAVVSHKN